MRKSLWDNFAELGSAPVISSSFRLSMAILMRTSMECLCAASRTRRGTAPRLSMSCCICAEHQHRERHLQGHYCRGKMCSTHAHCHSQPSPVEF